MFIFFWFFICACFFGIVTPLLRLGQYLICRSGLAPWPDLDKGGIEGGSRLSAMPFDRFPVSLEHLSLPVVAIAILVLFNYSSFLVRRPAARFVYYVTEKLIILLGACVISLFYIQYHTLSTYYVITFDIPHMFKIGGFLEDLNLFFNLLSAIPMRCLAIIGASFAVWYAFSPVPGALGTLGLLLLPYWSRRLRYWRLKGRLAESWSTTSSCDLLLISDLHIDAGEGTLQGNHHYKDMRPWLDETVKRSGARAILVLGDVTDTGAPVAWQQAASFFRGLGVETAVIPGNHDFHFRRFNAGSDAGNWVENWKAVLNAFQGTAGSYDESSICENLAALVGQAAGQGYPKLYRFRGVPVDALLLNSNKRPSGWPITNAIGLVGEEQLAAARRQLSWRDDRRDLLIALHHHIIPPVSIDAPLLACVDYEAVLDFALEAGATAIVHGHTHMPYVLNYTEPDRAIRIISCGSAMFEAGGPLAKKIKYPSCFGLNLENGRLSDVITLFRHEPDTVPARADPPTEP